DLVKRDRMTLHVAWAQACRVEDVQWRKHLRWLRDWLMPRGKCKNDKSIRRVGGLSLTRIASLKSLYQIQKAYRMRPEPDDPRKNVPAAGDDSLEKFGQQVLDTMEHLREQRVKQLASRIAEAALGVGDAQKRAEHRLADGKTILRQPKRRVEMSADSRFAPCHAVVIENLDHYRPEEVRTRRENRQLMEWSSTKVGKHLAEACELHGLHLRNVAAAYTSRQDSRTGLPGVRCSDIAVKDFLTKVIWRKQVESARARSSDGKEGTARDRYLVALDDRWKSHKENPPKDAKPLRIQVKGGELFVSSVPTVKGALQADLNAAANIGLKALLDPDWEGRWWYVPCDTKTGKPVADKVKGSPVFDEVTSLQADPSTQGKPPKTHKKNETAEKKEKEIVNLWRDPSSTPLRDGGDWQATAEYWRKAEYAVVNKLRGEAGLPA
ncbi:MAG: type V CRISPR-associated protein Cas12b, partial [Burkholderiales bacterium]